MRAIHTYRPFVFSLLAVYARDAVALVVQVMLYNPMDVGKVAMLLQAGAVMGRHFQPSESHIPFLLQIKVSRATTSHNV